MADWFDEIDAQPLSSAEQTYANQTAAREAYYNQNPDQAPVFSEEQQAGLDDILARNQATAPAAPPVVPPPPDAGGQTDPYARRRFQEAWQASSDHSPAALQALIASDPSFAGITVSGRSEDVVNLPGYVEAGTGIYRGPESLDVIGDVGGANQWAWSGLGGPGGGGPGGGGGGGGGPAPVAIQPAAVPSAITSARTGTAGTVPLELPAFTEAFTYNPWTRRFEPPDPEKVLSDPGYQARARAGQQALERSASAGGTLNTGGTLKDVYNYGQAEASREYEKAYGRKVNEYQSDYGDYLGGYERALGEYGQRAGIFGQNYQRGLQGFQSAQQAQEQQFGQGFRNRELGQRASEFGQNLGYNYANLGQQQNQFGQRLGYDYDTFGANLLSGAAGRSNAEYTAGADATARGQAESGSAYQYGLSGIANLGQDVVAGYGSRNPSDWTLRGPRG